MHPLGGMQGYITILVMDFTNYNDQTISNIGTEIQVHSIYQNTPHLAFMMWLLVWALAMLLHLLVAPMVVWHPPHIFLTSACCAWPSRVWVVTWTPLKLILRGCFAISFGLFHLVHLITLLSLLHWSPLSFLDLELDSPLWCDFNSLLPDWLHLLALPC